MATYTKDNLDAVEKAIYASLVWRIPKLDLEIDNIFEQDGKIVVILTKAED